MRGNDLDIFYQTDRNQIAHFGVRMLEQRFYNMKNGVKIFCGSSRF